MAYGMHWIHGKPVGSAKMEWVGLRATLSPASILVALRCLADKLCVRCVHGEHSGTPVIHGKSVDSAKKEWVGLRATLSPSSILVALRCLVDKLCVRCVHGEHSG
jgi:hypothetical protein